ncbi:hypothetical protein NP233_g8709 [Leucocoprinus birnbaumii]|uniref:Uncharacterized protein n=1 Tax=Leucocoprinus birnbaumii TaxID=56174 RepID=A0AAD5VM18_9AGAR|nr:hypothetical protein NP233_g8709 [Leucocoprinus birnbaumii]
MDAVTTFSTTHDLTLVAISLPHEIIGIIIEACSDDLSLLCAWSLVSHACLLEARLHLYYEVIFTGRSPFNLPPQTVSRRLGWSGTTKFIDLTRKRPELLRFVQHLKVELIEGPWPMIIWQAFLEIFPAMSALKSFRLVMIYAADPRGIFSLNLNTLFSDSDMKLKKLSLSLPSIPSTYFKDFHRLLEVQQQLEELHLVLSDWEPSTLSVEACPRLHTLTTSNHRILMAVSPGRPLVKLCWYLPRLHLQKSAYDSHSLIEAFRRIRILILRGSSDHLDDIVPHLPNVEVLDLHDLDALNPESLKSLTSLRVFVCREEAELHEQQALIKQWFSPNTTLRLVFLQPRHSQRFSRWTKGIDVPSEAGDSKSVPLLNSLTTANTIPLNLLIPLRPNHAFNDLRRDHLFVIPKSPLYPGFPYTAEAPASPDLAYRRRSNPRSAYNPPVLLPAVLNKRLVVGRSVPGSTGLWVASTSLAGGRSEYIQMCLPGVGVDISLLPEPAFAGPKAGDDIDSVFETETWNEVLVPSESRRIWRYGITHQPEEALWFPLHPPLRGVSTQL